MYLEYNIYIYIYKVFYTLIKQFLQLDFLPLISNLILVAQPILIMGTYDATIASTVAILTRKET